jgi:hypothetical protein
MGSALPRVLSITERPLATMATADSYPTTGRATPPGASQGSAVSTEWASLGSLTAWLRPNALGAWTWSTGSLPALNPLSPPTSLTAPSSRSPRIRTWTFAAQLRHLAYPSDCWASSCVAAPGAGPSMAFLFVSSQLGRRLPSDPSSRKRPCPWLAVTAHTVGLVLLQGTSTPMPGVPQPHAADR